MTDSATHIHLREAERETPPRSTGRRPLVVLLLALLALCAGTSPALAQLDPEPWPTAYADNRNTSQSRTLADVTPRVIPSAPVHSPAATGPNGNLYYKTYNGSSISLLSATPEGDVNWSIELAGRLNISPGTQPSSPIVTEQYVYFLAPADGVGTGLYRVDLGGDGLIAVIDSGNPVSDTPAIGNDNQIYVPRQGGQLTFVSVEGGTPVLEDTYETDGTRVTSPLVLPDGRILVATGNGGLFAFSPAGDRGESLVEGDGEFLLPPVVSKDNVAYLVTFGDSEEDGSPTPQLVAVDVDASEDNTLWSQPLDGGSPVGIAAGPNGHVYVTTTGSTNSAIQRYNVEGGVQDWSYAVSGTVSAPSVRDSDPSVQVAHQPASSEGQVILYAADEVGTELPSIPLNGEQSVGLAPTITGNGDVVVGTSNGLVLADGVRPVVSPASVDFGITLTTDTDPAQAGVTIDNPDTGQRLDITGVFVTGTDAAAFNVVNGDELVTDGIDGNSSATLDLEYRSATAGTFDATLAVSTELFGDFLVPLTGKTIEEGLTGTPNPLVFDTILLNNTQTKTVEVSSTDSDVMLDTVTLFDNAAGDFSLPGAGSFSGTEINSGTPLPIDVDFSPEGSGLRSAILEVTTTQGTTLQIGLEGSGLDASLSVTPDPVIFGDVETNTNAVQAVTLSNTGTDALPISSISTTAAGTNDYTISSSGFTSIPAGGSETVDVTFLPTVGGTRTGELVIQTGADLEARVALSGNGVEPDLVLNPDPLTFGTIDLEDTATASFTIENPKTVGVTVTGISIDNADFSVTGPTSFSVAGETTETVDVQFDPSATGLTQSTLTVNTDAGFTREVTVAGEARDVSVSATPSPVEFSGVERESKKEILVTFSNTGSVSLSNISTAITNNGDSEFSINGANTDLGTSLSTSTSADIAVVYEPDNEESNSGTLDIQYEGIPGNVETLSISLSGSGINASQPVTFDTDGPLTFLDTPVNSTSASQTLTIANPSSSDYNLTEISLAGTNPGDFVIESVTDQNGNTTTVNGPTFDNGGDALNLPGGESVTADIAFAPGQSGGLAASVNIFIDNNLNTTATVSGTGILPTLTATPDPLDLGQVATGSTVTEQVTLSNPTSVPVTITSAQVTDAAGSTGFSLTNAGTVVSTIAAGSSVTADLSFSSSAVERDEAVLEVGINNAGTLQVPLRAQVDEYNLAFTQSPFTFSSVPVDSSATETITIENTGTAAFDYSFEGFTGDASDFAITSGQESGTLAAGDTRSVIVTFTPQASGTRAADLTAEASLDGSLLATATATLDGVGLEYDSRISPTNADFGNVPVGATSSQQTIVVENAGSAILSILGLSLPSGSPFRIVSGRGSLSLLAGEQLEVVVDFTPEESRLVSTSLEVLTVTGTRTVGLTGRGIAKLSSADALSFPTRLDSEPADTLQATFTNGNDISADVTGVTLAGADPSAFSVDIPSTLPSILPGDSLDVPVALTATAAGTYSAELTVDASTGTSVLNLVGEVLPAPGISPDTLRYGQVIAGESQTETLAITNDNALSLTIESASSVSGDVGGLQIATPLPLTIPAGESASLDVSLAPSDALGEINETLTVASTIDLNSEEDGGEEGVDVYSVQQVIPIRANVVAPPNLAAEPTGPVDFGALASGETTATRSFRLINTGGAPLTIVSAGLASTDAPFALSTNPSGTIAPGDTLAFDVTAAPTTVGDSATSLDIESDGGSASIQLQVTSIEIDFQIDDAQLGEATTARLTLPSFAPTAERSLYVRPGGASAYEALPFEATSQTEWTVEIPARFASLRGFDYFVLVSDGQTALTLPGATEAESRAEPVHARVQFDATSTPKTMPAGSYTMVSVPADIATTDPAEVFGDDYGDFNPRVWRLLRYDPALGEYREAKGIREVQSGQAFWLATSEGAKYDIGPGRSTDASTPQTMELQPGWNQIASPFGFTVAWADVQGAAGLEPPVVYDGTDYDYTRPVLQPWSGAWVFNPGDQVRAITIPPVAASAATSAIASSTESLIPARAKGGYTIQLRAQLRSGDVTLRDDANYFGLREGASGGLDSLDFAEAPPVGNHVRLSISDVRRPLAGSYRPTGEDGQTWNMKLAASTEKSRAGQQETVRLSLVEHGAKPDGYEVYVFDLDRQMPLPVENGGVSVPLEGDEARSLRLVAGSETFAKSKSDGIPLEQIDTKLGKPYPNPLESEATIEYQLQKPEYVRMEVYDILGRRVATLVNEEKTAGRHRFQWNPSDGRTLASGVYFLRMRAGKFSTTQKMTIVR